MIFTLTYSKQQLSKGQNISMLKKERALGFDHIASNVFFEFNFIYILKNEPLGCLTVVLF